MKPSGQPPDIESKVFSAIRSESIFPWSKRVEAEHDSVHNCLTMNSILCAHQWDRQRTTGAEVFS